MLIIGLTGSIGMGKSTAAKRFRALGVPVIDADALVHELYEGAAAPMIEAAFPGVTRNDKVDRQRLSQALLADPFGFKRLETIVHPLVQAAERAALNKANRSGAPIAVLEIPLLFETGGDAHVDVTVVVSAPADEQRRRVLLRPGMSPEKLDAMLGRQTPDAEKRRRANFVVDTGGSIQAAEQQIDGIVQTLMGRTGQAFEKFWA